MSLASRFQIASEARQHTAVSESLKRGPERLT